MSEHEKTQEVQVPAEFREMLESLPCVTLSDMTPAGALRLAADLARERKAREQAESREAALREALEEVRSRTDDIRAAWLGPAAVDADVFRLRTAERVEDLQRVVRTALGETAPCTIPPPGWRCTRGAGLQPLPASPGHVWQLVRGLRQPHRRRGGRGVRARAGQRGGPAGVAATVARLVDDRAGHPLDPPARRHPRRPRGGAPWRLSRSAPSVARDAEAGSWATWLIWGTRS